MRIRVINVHGSKRKKKDVKSRLRKVPTVIYCIVLKNQLEQNEKHATACICEH